MKNLLIVISLAVLGLSLGQAQTTVKYPEDTPNFSISFPEGWKQKQMDTSFVEMESPDESIWLDVWYVKDKDPDANSVDDIVKDMNTWLTDIKIDRNKAGDFKVGTIDFISYSGTGKTKDGAKDQDIEADLCSVDGKSTIVIMYYGDKGAGAKNADDLRFIANSVKAIKDEQ